MFTVYSKPGCPHCDQAKALLNSLGMNYEVVNVDVGQPKVDGQQYITRDAILSMYPNLRTVPFITKGEIKIGGYLDLRRFVEQQGVIAS
jgi:glutaredoxin